MSRSPSWSRLPRFRLGKKNGEGGKGKIDPGPTSSRARPTFPATSVKRVAKRTRDDGTSIRRSIGAPSWMAAERDGSGTTSRGELNEPNRISGLVWGRRAATLDCDVRDDYDVYEVLPHRAGFLHRTAPARLAERCVLDAREATRRGVGVASPSFNSIAMCIPLITGNIPARRGLGRSSTVCHSSVAFLQSFL